MSKVTSLKSVVAHGLCTGCGICESLIGRDTVEMRLTSYGQLRPQFKGPIKQDLEASVLDICPGSLVVGPSSMDLGEAGTLDPVWGPIVSIHRSWAGDPAIRHRAAAGGTLTALGCYLLQSGEVDAVVHVKASATDPILTDAHVSYTPDDVIQGAQSRYGPAAPLVHVNALLDRGLKIAVIAKPCDIAAIRNLARIDARAREQVKYCLTLFCGGVPNTGTATDIAAHFGVSTDELSLFRWRGYGWPGTTHLETKDGRAFDLSYDDAWYNANKTWTYDMQFRCKICPDAIGELADVAAPDGWIMENGMPLHKEAPGANIAVARTKAGARLIERAVAAGALVLDRFTVPELYAMHGDHLDRKLGQPARNLGLKCAGQPGLRVKNYRPLAMVLRAGFKGNWRAFWGALRRALIGSNRETGI